MFVASLCCETAKIRAKRNSFHTKTTHALCPALLCIFVASLCWSPSHNNFSCLWQQQLQLDQETTVFSIPTLHLSDSFMVSMEAVTCWIHCWSWRRRSARVSVRIGMGAGSRKSERRWTTLLWQSDSQKAQGFSRWNNWCCSKTLQPFGVLVNLSADSGDGSQSRFGLRGWTCSTEGGSDWKHWALSGW